ncbi:hypothetical protein K525DRAFT_214259, partial [Schizophyllum commune Loenen D]
PDPPRFVYPCPPHSRVPQHASRTCSAQALSSSRRAVLYSVYIYTYILNYLPPFYARPSDPRRARRCKKTRRAGPNKAPSPQFPLSNDVRGRGELASDTHAFWATRQ